MSYPDPAYKTLPGGGLMKKIAAGAPVEYDTLKELAKGKQDKNKAYAPLEFSGLGKKTLEKNIVDVSGTDKNVLTQAMVSEANTEFIVQYDYDLNDPNGENPITIPANCALKFEGGSINNGKIVFQDTSLESCKECFGDDLVIEGKVLQEASPEWFTGSDADKIEKAINTFGVVKLAARDYLIDRTINVQHSFRLNGIGIPSNFGDYATPSKSDDYSSSRLIPIADIGSILSCVNPSGHFVSLVLSGVSFVRPTHEAWFSDYKTATTNVHGFAFSTPNGPSRPIVIENCNFKYLNYGIYVYDYDPTLDRSTNASRLFITGCNISNNKQGIHAEGTKALGAVMIMSNVIEQNTEHGIYAYNPAGSDFEGIPAMSGGLIVNNLMEGQASPLYVSISGGTLLFQHNYFEKSNGTTTVTVKGEGTLQAKDHTFILDSNVASSNIGDGVVFDLSNLYLIDRDNANAKGSLLLSAVKIVGQTNKKIRTTFYCGYTPRIDVNTTQPLLKGLITPNYIYDGKVQMGYTTSSGIQSYITLTEALPAGSYTLVAFGRQLALALRKYVSGTTTTIFDYSYASPMPDAEYTVNERAFTLSEAIPAGAELRIGVQGGSGAFSGFAIYADDGSAHNRYSINPLDYVTSAKGEVVNPQIGVEWYDKALSKTLRIADIVNGAAMWKDIDGFTPALSRGATAQRPTTQLMSSDASYVYHDEGIRKDIFLSVGDLPYYGGYSVNSGGTTFISNTFIESTEVSLDVSKTGAATLKGGITIAFVKAEDDESDAIYVQDLLAYTTTTSDAYARGSVIAPDPTIYTKIKLTNTAVVKVFFKIFIAPKSWIDAAGFTANISKGTTAQRPTDLFGINDDGYPYYDTTLQKNVYLKSKVGTRLFSQQVGGQASMHIANTCVEGETYRLTFSSNNTYSKYFIFRKAEGDPFGQIIVVYTAQNIGTAYFRAPSATEYPYIYLYNGRPTGSNQTFYVDNVVKGWVEEDGAVAGVARSGDTASRPASMDIYVGFQYWDTTLGKMIAWNGTSWVNLDGTALT